MSQKRFLAATLITVVGLWLGTWWLAVSFIPSWGERGQFGDLFGSVNALFSGLAFAGLLVTVRLQQSQLELQRHELQLQRDELKLQREEMASSRKELERQVLAQQALYRATVAQIAVAAANAHIEAIKMDSESVNVTGRARFVNEIKVVASALEALANKVEGQNNAG